MAQVGLLGQFSWYLRLTAVSSNKPSSETLKTNNDECQATAASFYGAKKKMYKIGAKIAKLIVW